MSNRSIKFRKSSYKTVIKECPECHDRFRPTRTEYNHCSVKCGAIASRRKKGQYLILKCDFCGNKHHKSRAVVQKNDKNYCSLKCQSMNLKRILKGKGNPNWRGGTAHLKSGVSGKNRFFIKGRAYEYKTMKKLESEGFYTIRSSGSHGLFDIVGIRNDGIRFIQVKSGLKNYLSPREKQEIVNLMLPDNCQKEIWRWLPRREPKIEIL